MLMTLGVTDFDQSLTIQVVTRSEDSYDDAGNGVKGGEADPVDIKADVQPTTGKALQDLPEGLRDQVDFTVWTNYPLTTDEILIYMEQRYKVVKTWPRPSDGFTKAMIGKMKSD